MVRSWRKARTFWTIPWPNSLGLFYAQFTQYLGFQPYSDEWKVMGLAPYGEPGISLRDFIDPNDNPYKVSARVLLGRDSTPIAGIESRLGPRRIPESEIDIRHKNLAFAVQDSCEEAMITLARAAVEKTGCRNLCLAGGVALNSKANGKIAASGLVDRIFVQPAASDDGVCLGACLAPYMAEDGTLPVHKMRHAYLGSASSDEEIEKTLKIYKLRASRVTDPAEAAAEMLANGKILGWFQGRMEFGPRALGARSILADPRDPEMNAKVNNAVKFREWWRPFAPSMLAEVAGEYIESATDSPFMILTAQVRPEKRSVIPSVTHVDGSARPQTVERDVNPLYWRLIRKFGDRTGVPVVMNTSFNLRVNRSFAPQPMQSARSSVLAWTHSSSARSLWRNNVTSPRNWMATVMLRLPASLRSFRRVPVLGSLVHTLSYQILSSDQKVWVQVAAGPAKGIWLELNPRTGQNYRLGATEKTCQAVIAETVRPGDIFYDLGANIGLFSLLAAKAAGPTGKVFGFEPDVQIAERLAAMLRVTVSQTSLLLRWACGLPAAS